MTDNNYVKWSWLWAILMVIFSCIGSLFTIQSSMKSEYRNYIMDIKQDMATVKESVLWLKELKPKTNNTVGVNVYQQIEDKANDREEFINKIKQLAKEE